MSIYEELVAADKDYGNRWNECLNVARQAIGQLLSVFSQDCEIPTGHLRYLKCDVEVVGNDNVSYREAEGNSNYTWMGAMTFCDDGFWHLGVKLMFSKREFPERYIFFTLAVTVRNGKPVAQVPGGKDHPLDLKDRSTFVEYSEKIIALAREHYAADPVSNEAGIAAHSKSYGFSATPVVKEEPNAQPKPEFQSTVAM